VQVGDIFALGEHHIIICGDSTDPGVLEVLMFGEDKARLILTDEPDNGSVAGHETTGEHRGFLLANGEMNDAEFRAFNTAWIGACLPYVCDGGLYATFTDWRGYPAVVAAALQLGLAPFDLIVWAKTDGAMGDLYRSQHELLPLFKIQEGKGHPTLITSSAARSGVRDRMFGPIRVLAWAPKRAKDCRTTRPSSRLRCWKMRCAI